MPLDKDDNNNSWHEWSRFVLEELKRLNKVYNELDKKVDKITVEIATLNVKAGVWGALAGAIPVVIGLAVIYLKGNL